MRYISSSYPGTSNVQGTGNKIQFIIILLYIYCLKWLLLLGRDSTLCCAAEGALLFSFFFNFFILFFFYFYFFS